MTAILRYTAFTDTPEGGNPAGVVLDASELSDAEMQQIAADVGYSESAFVTTRDDGSYDVRYFSPAMEVPFCGHATIATAVALAERDGAGPLTFHTQAGVVPVATQGTQRLRHGHAHQRRPPRRGGARATCSTPRSKPCAGTRASSTRRSRPRSPTPARAT